MQGYQNIIILICSLWPIFLIIPIYEMVKNKYYYYIIMSIFVVGSLFFHNYKKIIDRLTDKSPLDIQINNGLSVLFCSLGQLLLLCVINKLLKKYEFSHLSIILFKISQVLLIINLVMRWLIIIYTGFDLGRDNISNNIFWKYRNDQETIIGCPVSNMINNLNKCGFGKAINIAIVMLPPLIMICINL